MTAENSGSLASPVASLGAEEKSWWQSKKFIAFLMTDLGLFVLMGAMIWVQETNKIGDNLAFMILAVTSGFISTGYILGQAALDKYIRVATITMRRNDPDPSEGKK